VVAVPDEDISVSSDFIGQASIIHPKTEELSA